MKKTAYIQTSLLVLALIFALTVPTLLLNKKFSEAQIPPPDSKHSEMMAAMEAVSNRIRTLEQTNPAAGQNQAPDELQQIKAEFAKLQANLVKPDQLSQLNQNLIEKISQLASTDLTLASFVLTGWGVFFALFAFMFGVSTIGRYQEIKRELEEQARSLETSRQQLRAQLHKLRAQEDSATATTAFVEAVAERFFSDALPELLRELQKADALTTAADKSLRAKSKEVQSRIFLRHPNSERVNAAIQVLEGLGSRDAIQDLSELIGDSRIPSMTQKLAARAIAKISDRP